jgi:hypothetical protein
MAKRTNTSNPVESDVAVMDTPDTDTLSDAETILLDEMIAADVLAAADGSDDESESESTPETLSEMMARLTAEKFESIAKRELEIASEKLAITLNIKSDVVRLMAVDLLNSESFTLPDGLDLESGSTVGLALEFNVDSATWSMSIDAVVKLPRVRTVASVSDGSTAQNTIWFTSFTNPSGTKFDAPMLVKNDGTVSETRNDLAACALILGFDIKNNGQYTMNANAKQKRITENGWTFETAQNFQS